MGVVSDGRVLLPPNSIGVAYTTGVHQMNRNTAVQRPRTVRFVVGTESFKPSMPELACTYCSASLAGYG
eukprot:5146944-Pleurochrysis_carterae.AAC.1